MNFDPEKVRRWPEFEQKKDGTFAESGPSVILASDYDKLLALYRKSLDDHGPKGSLQRMAAETGQFCTTQSHQSQLQTHHRLEADRRPLVVQK